MKEQYWLLQRGWVNARNITHNPSPRVTTSIDVSCLRNRAAKELKNPGSLMTELSIDCRQGWGDPLSILDLACDSGLNGKTSD